MRKVALVLVVLLVAGGVFLYYPRATGTAAANAATLGVLNGDVDAQHGSGTFAPATDGDVLGNGDVVRANASGRAVLTFFDASTLTLEPGAQIKVVSVERQPSGALSTVIEQTLGRTWASVERLKGETKFEIRTPSSTAVVRGTAFEISVAADGTTTVKTTEGEVIVQAQGQQQSVTAGNQNTTPPGGPPAPQVPQPPTPKLRLTTGLAGLAFTVIDPQGRSCGATGSQQIRQIPGCNVVLTGAGGIVEQADIGEVLAGTYTMFMTASATIPGINVALSGGADLASPDFRQQYGDAAGIRQGEVVKTTFQVGLAGPRTSGQAFSASERVASLCGAEVRGRTFTGNPAEALAALRAYG